MSNYEGMSLEELTKLCKKRDIEIPEDSTAAEIINILVIEDWGEGDTEEDKSAEKKEEAPTKPRRRKTEKAEKLVTAAETEEQPTEEASTNKEAEAKKENKEKEDEVKPRTKRTRRSKKAAAEEESAGEDAKTDDVVDAASIVESGTRVKIKRKERLYHDNRNKPIMIDIDEQNQISESERAERELLFSSSDHHAYLSGTIQQVTSISKIKLNDSYRAIVKAIVPYKGKKISIVSPLFFPDWERIPDEELLKKMQMRIGSEIDFVLSYKSGEGPDTVYLGSRVDAMRAKREEYWFGKKRRKGETVYRINEGDKVEARVVFVTAKLVHIEVFGVETVVPVNDIAYEYVPDARDRYATGDRVTVRIMDIDRDMSDASIVGTKDVPPEFNVKVVASIKSTIEDPREVHYNEYNVNDSCLGIVTSYDGSGEAPRYFVNINGEVDVFCWMKKGVVRLPEEGDKVTVKIARKYDKKKRITGTITHVHK